MREIDCRGMECSEPIVEVKKYFDSIGEGEATVIVDNEIALNNVTKFATGHGYQVENNEENEYEMVIQKRGCLEILEDEKNIVLLITSDELGNGSEALGKTLMKNYIYALSENEELPKKIFFINSGVNLTVEGSEVLESLNTLDENGVEIYSCGTCLDFYGLKEKLEIGEITNMDTIVEAMNKSDNLIKL
ncbi:MAG: sulfurtransferase-like selenium metabolism protein YedF [Clostridium sp.]